MRRETGYDLISAVMATANALLREGSRLFRPHRLTGAQFNVLNVIAQSADGLSQRELSDHLVVDRSNVTGLLDRMEKAGWVRRADDPRDRRVYRVRLTAEGRRLWQRVTPQYLDVVRQVTRGISEDRMHETLALLRRIEGAAATWELPGTPVRKALNAR